VVDARRLTATTEEMLGLPVPGRASAITDQVSAFLAHRKVVGWVGGLSLLFFSAMVWFAKTGSKGMNACNAAATFRPLAGALRCGRF
jgi:hypothetical protein